jgi:hypothetical protein
VKKGLTALVLVLVVAVAGTYYYFSGREYVFRFTEAQLQEQLDQQLPLTRSYFLIFQVTLDNPRVSLTDGSNRVRAGLDIVLNAKAGGESRPLGGTIDVTGGVKYVAAKGEFFLTDPVIERLELQGVSPKYAGSVRAVMTKAIAEYYSTHPIYSLKATDVNQAAARLVLKDVVVQGQTLVVTLGV